MPARVLTVGKHKFRYAKESSAWVANGERLIVRKSLVRPKLWCADYKVGRDSHTCIRRGDGLIRRFQTKETAMAALVKFWDNL